MLTLGTQPDRLDVALVPDADFIESVETLTQDLMNSQPWPMGTQLALVFGNATSGPLFTWPAIIDGHVISWTVQSPNVNAVIDSGLTDVRLWYENGTVRIPLAIGNITVWA